MITKNKVLPVFTLVLCFVASGVFTNQGGPTTGVAGDPPLNETCAEIGCHNGSGLNSGSASATISVKDSTGQAVSSYIPDQKYTISFSISEGTKTRYGFEGIVKKGAGTNAAVIGTMAVIDPVKTRLFGGSIKYAQHTSSGTDFSTTTGTWQMKWTAPAFNEGNATVYVAFNAANKDGTSNGDRIYTRTLVLSGTGSTGLDGPIPVRSDLHFNVASGILQVSASRGATIHVINLNGQLIQSFVAQGTMQSLSLATVPSGIYIIAVNTNNASAYYKFVKP